MSFLGKWKIEKICFYRYILSKAYYVNFRYTNRYNRAYHVSVFPPNTMLEA